ncbi:major facilitator superfamily transporter [Neocallimastix lanati (nom. inval.)]|jgi:EmrB/QacA subfamily drug resistance transporter|uniref:Major facilitator superfamily transporter n=1 Tax=Neocallimastix californiae TaxID=1754190 RepID=A0A1Y2DZQ7_9FUNG|nr:major facilitator superfamily transporter [Neocallimastix sp. JGI-2020a]ORY64586.1 major facilitator superfamily transporter [Neocallimastix californiae]|eukprot:ORY64586.1 major facilitator superfamily transporter [Neocallimastix californiae]
MDNLIKTEGKKVSDKKRTSIFLNINVSCIATSMLGTALTTALPPIMEDLNMTVNTAQWLTSGFILFLAVMTPFTAYLISRFRTKRLYCIAIGFFIVGLTICACSNSFWMMMLGRIIQGCGNGLLSSMAQVIILTIFPPERIGTIMGWYGLSIGVAPIISPTIAGILVDSVGWRMIFIIAIAIMSISLICAVFVFEDVLPTMNKHFDVISLFFSALAFGGVTLAVGNMGTYKFVSWEVLFALIVGLVTSVIFAYRQLHIEVPFLDIRVLKNWDFSVSLTATVVIQLIFMGTSIIVPVYIQQIKGESATISGLVTLPGSLVWTVISPFAGKIYDKIGMKLLFIIGSVILIFSNLPIFFISIHHSVWIFSGINVFRSLACGALLMPLVTWAMKDIPKIKASDATALYNSIRFIAGAVASALFISVMTKISNASVGKKESPQMYGINVVFLIMTFLSVILLLIGIFGCKEKFIKKRVIEEEKAVKEMTMKSFSDVEIDIDKEKTLDNISVKEGSENGTVIDIDNEISIDDLSVKDKSDADTIIDNDISLKIESSKDEKDDTIEVINTEKN